MNAGRLLVIAGCGLTLGAALYSQGCGGSDNAPAADFRGNVTSVEPPLAAASIQSPASRRTFFARLDLEPLKGLWASAADAQSAVCSATTRQTLAHVLACVETVGAAPNPAATPSPQPTPNRTAVCSPVSARNCTFSTDLEVADDGKPALLFFVEDANENGEADANELEAVLVSPLPDRICNGDVIEISDVDVNFENGTAAAGGAITKQVDACPAATATPTRTATRTRAPASPAPTTAGTPATPTPTRTSTPGMPTPRRTGTPGTPGTATPTRTGTPGMPTPTRTGTPGTPGTATPTRTGTPGTATPTRTAATPTRTPTTPPATTATPTRMPATPTATATGTPTLAPTVSGTATPTPCASQGGICSATTPCCPGLSCLIGLQICVPPVGG